MERVYNFSPGPSALPLPVLEKVKEAQEQAAALAATEAEKNGEAVQQEGNNVGAGSDMCIQKIFIVRSEYHIRRDQDDIIAGSSLDDILIIQEGSDVCVVDFVYFTLG